VKPRENSSGFSQAGDHFQSGTKVAQELLDDCRQWIETGLQQGSQEINDYKNF
jgi:hypothetical protein